MNGLEALTAFKKVVAPFDGVVIDRRIDIGDLVTAGSTASTSPLYTVAQADKIRVFVDVPQALSGDVRVGMTAVANSDQFRGHPFSGKVARTSNAIDLAARTLKVEVDVENPDLLLMPGAYLEVNLQTAEARSSLLVPAAALTFRSGGPQVAIVGKDGVVKFRNVTISRELGDSVEISSGITDGEMVALNVSNQVSDGDHVQAVVQPSAQEQTPTPTPHETALR